jgi:PIN domain nuclease of toxin-antitoxin system
LGSRRISQSYLLDTHIWFWYLTKSARLPARLLAILEAASDRLWLSPISVWELTLLRERGRIELDQHIRAWVDAALKLFPLREAPVTREVALACADLELAHRDPADRFLAATALVYELTLVTADERLVAAVWLPTA